MRKHLNAPILAMAVSVGLYVAPANGQTFSGSFLNPVTLNQDTATATFSLLTVGASTYMDLVLTNTSTFADYGNNDLLNGVFWAMGGSPAITPFSASTGTLVQPGQCSTAMVATCSGATVDVGGEFGYQFSAGGYTGAVETTGQYGIGASGYAFVTPSFGAGQTDYFGSSPQNLAGPSNNVGGPDFSIVGSAYSAPASQNSVQNTPLLNQSVTFRFLMPSGVSTLNISNVIFAYGTNPDATNAATQTPEPATLGVLAVSLAGFAAVRRRRAWRRAGTALTSPR